jgi:hypothetical protein
MEHRQVSLGRLSCRSRVVIGRLAGAAIVRIAQAVLFLALTRFRGVLAGPPSAGALGPEATAIPCASRIIGLRRQRSGHEAVQDFPHPFQPRPHRRVTREVVLLLGVLS